MATRPSKVNAANAKEAKTGRSQTSTPNLTSPPRVEQNGMGPPKSDDLELLPISKQAVQEASSYSQSELASLVGLYEKIQKIRVGARNAEAAHERMADDQHVAFPTEEEALEAAFGQTLLNGLQEGKAASTLAVTEIKDNLKKLEEHALKAMRKAVKGHPLGKWLLSIQGMGEVVAATLLAYVDFKRCCCEPYRYWRGGKREEIPPHECQGLVTAGHVWSYCGIMGMRPWEKGSIRPYNMRLKTVLLGLLSRQLKVSSVDEKDAFLSLEGTMLQISEERYKKKGKNPPSEEKLQELAESLRDRRKALYEKMYQDPSYLYCRLYREHKRKIALKNEQGGFQEDVEKRLAEAEERYKKRSPKEYAEWQKSPQRQCWLQGKMAPIGVDRHAIRKAVTIFLSHFHEVGYQLTFGKLPPKPFALSHLAPRDNGQHVHYIAPPNWPMK